MKQQSISCGELHMASKLTAPEIIRSIGSGQVDHALEEISAAVRARFKVRQETRALQASSEIQSGDRIAFTDKIRPTTLVGATATVRDKKGGMLVVDLDEIAFNPRWSNAKGVKVSANLVKEIKK